MGNVLEQNSHLLNYKIHMLLSLQSMQYRQNLLSSGGKYADQRNLNRFEHQILSQCGEDGIIEEIFNRIGTTNRYFVEFGAGNGLQNCTASLLFRNWTGAWIEGDPRNTEIIRHKFAPLLLKHRLSFAEAFITAENIGSLFEQLEVPESFDCMSIDIDGNDYWVWNSITKHRPRVVICEYNARYGGQLTWVMKYNPAHSWNGSCYYGASLKALELLGASKGYKLVGCNLAGVNAFFVRDDCVGDHFPPLYSSEYHFEPQRLFLVEPAVQSNDFGPFETM